MKTSEERLAWAIQICTKARMRVTSLREAILSFLANERLPATLERVSQAEGIRGNCDATTVYRTLMMFKEAGLVRVVGTPQKASYFVLNIPGEGQHFLICRRCGCILELPLPPALAQAITKVACTCGFSSTPQDCEVHGICNNCQHTRQHEPLPSKLA